MHNPSQQCTCCTPSWVGGVRAWCFAPCTRLHKPPCARQRFGPVYIFRSLHMLHMGPCANIYNFVAHGARATNWGHHPLFAIGNKCIWFSTSGPLIKGEISPWLPDGGCNLPGRSVNILWRPNLKTGLYSCTLCRQCTVVRSFRGGQPRSCDTHPGEGNQRRVMAIQRRHLLEH